MKKEVFVVGLVCLLFGFFVGRYLLPEERKAQVNGDRVVNLGGANFRDENGHRKSYGDQKVGGQGLVFRERKPREVGVVGSGELLVPESLISDLDLLDLEAELGAGLIHDQNVVVKHLGVSAAEREGLLDLWETLNQDVAQIESQVAKVDRADDESVEVIIPELSSRVAKVGEVFEGGVREVLGERRGRTFLHLKKVNQIFGSFNHERRFHFKTEPVGDRENWRYHITLSGEGASQVWVTQTIPEELRHLSDLAGLEADFFGE